jgi:hypothetical protein
MTVLIVDDQAEFRGFARRWRPTAIAFDSAAPARECRHARPPVCSHDCATSAQALDCAREVIVLALDQDPSPVELADPDDAVPEVHLVVGIERGRRAIAALMRQRASSGSSGSTLP